MTSPAHRGVSAYSNVGVQTHAAKHDQHQLVALMFEHVLESLNAARGAIQQGNVEVKLKAIDKAMRIVQIGLRTSLDLENGGELAANLAALYDYCVLRMTQANLKNDEAALAEVVGLLKPVADSWGAIRAGKAGTDANISADKPAVSDEPVKPAPARRVSSLYGAAAPLRGVMAVGA